MRQLMRNDRGDHLFIQGGRFFAYKQGGLPKSDEPPVLHGSCQEVRDRYQVCKK